VSFEAVDGRHEGLLDIAPDSPQEFADWLDGVHPKRRNRCVSWLSSDAGRV
jgi:hypothetical protein